MNEQKSAFFHIADKLDKLNATVQGISVLSFSVDYSTGLVIRLQVYQNATEKTHNFTLTLSPEDLKQTTKTDEEIINGLFQPIIDALNSIQIVKSVGGTQILDASGDVITKH